MVIGAALDIVTWCGVPRYVYNDLPLGNPLGPPFDRQAHRRSVSTALSLIESAAEPTVVETGMTWPGDDRWKENYMRIDDSNPEALKRIGEENRRKRKYEIELGLRRK